MSEKNDFAEGKAICNEIGGAVLEVLARGREFSVQSLIDLMQESQIDGHNYGKERDQGMEIAIRILRKFV